MDNLPSNRKRRKSSSQPAVTSPSPTQLSPSIPTSSPPPRFSELSLTPPRSPPKTLLKPNGMSLLRRNTPVYIRELKSLLSSSSNGHTSSRLFFPPAPPAYASHPEETTLRTCAACGLDISFADARAGPHGTFFHKHCMLCARCGERLQGHDDGGFGGDGAFVEDACGPGKTRRWYGWTHEGELRLSCRACWIDERRREGRLARGILGADMALSLDGMREERVPRKRKRARWCCTGRR